MSNKKHIRDTYRGLWSDSVAADVIEAEYENSDDSNSHETQVLSGKRKEDKEHAVKNIAIFPGTFDPLTIGHQSIVERALALFDEIIISIGVNEATRGYFTIEQRIKMIINLSRYNPKLSV